jgi:hypothetical protein
LRDNSTYAAYSQRVSLIQLTNITALRLHYLSLIKKRGCGKIRNPFFI